MTTHSQESAHSQLVAGLSPGAAASILALGRADHLAAGVTVFRLGERADRLFIVTRGRVALEATMPLPDGEGPLLVEERGAGEIVGWSALIPPYRYTLQATALLDSDVIAIPRHALLEHLSAESPVGSVLMQNVARVVGQRLQVVQAMWLREMQQGLMLRARLARRSQ